METDRGPEDAGRGAGWRQWILGAPGEDGTLHVGIAPGPPGREVLPESWVAARERIIAVYPKRDPSRWEIVACSRDHFSFRWTPPDPDGSPPSRNVARDLVAERDQNDAKGLRRLLSAGLATETALWSETSPELSRVILRRMSKHSRILCGIGGAAELAATVAANWSQQVLATAAFAILATPGARGVRIRGEIEVKSGVTAILEAADEQGLIDLMSAAVALERRGGRIEKILTLAKEKLPEDRDRDLFTRTRKIVSPNAEIRWVLDPLEQEEECTSK